MNILQEHLGKKINLKNIHVYVQSKYCWLHLLNIQKLSNLTNRQFTFIQFPKQFVTFYNRACCKFVSHFYDLWVQSMYESADTAANINNNRQNQQSAKTTIGNNKNQQKGTWIFVLTILSLKCDFEVFKKKTHFVYCKFQSYLGFICWDWKVNKSLVTPS